MEVDLGAFGDKPERVVEFCAVLHLRPEHHLIVATLRAADPTHQPGLHKYSAAFEVPPGGDVARHGEVVVKQRFRMLCKDLNLAVEEAPPTGILGARAIRRAEMRELVDRKQFKPVRG